MKHLILCVAALSGATLSLAGCASVQTVNAAATAPAPDHQLMTTASSFAATEARLRTAIGSRDFRLFTVVDHGAGARSTGEDIGQSKLFIFGNPKGGTPLMQAAPGLGMDLPLKVLIHERPGGGTDVHYTDIKAVAARHGVMGQEDRLDKISATLAEIAGEAVG